MPDDIVNNDVVNDDNVNTDAKTDDVTKETDIVDEDKNQKDEKKGILETIKNIIKRTPNKDDESNDKDDDVDSDEDKDDVDSDTDGSDNVVTDDDIPDDFVDAALEYGFTQEQIINHAKRYTNEQLMSQIPFLQKSISDADDGSGKSGKKIDTSGETKKEDEKSDSKADIKDEVIAKLEARIATLEEGQARKTDDDANKELITMAERATAKLDEVSKQYGGVFGEFEKLPRFPDGTIIPNSPENIARNQVWVLAKTLKGTGMDFESALSVALNAYKGEHLDKAAHRNVVKQLRRSAKKVSAKRSSTTATSKAKTGVEVVREVLKKHGRS